MKKMKNALTKGSHESVHRYKKTRHQTLRLDHTDVNVKKVEEQVKTVYGKNSKSLKSCFVYQAFQFKEAVKPHLVSCEVFNGITLPPKYDIKPRSETKDGIEYMVFAFEYASKDKAVLNYDDSDESTVEGQ